MEVMTSRGKPPSGLAAARKDVQQRDDEHDPAVQHGGRHHEQGDADQPPAQSIREPFHEPVQPGQGQDKQHSDGEICPD